MSLHASKGVGGLHDDARQADEETQAALAAEVAVPALSPDEELAQLVEELAASDIHVFDGDQFIAKELPPPIWIIPDLIAKHYQCALYGKAKTKKTFFGLDLARHIATGRKFLYFPQPDKPHKVAYINIELMPFFMQERMRKQTGDEVRTLYGGNLTVFNCRGAGAKLRDKVETIKRLCLLKGIEIIIIDPRYKLMQGEEDENSAAGLRALLDFRTSLAEVAAVLLVGHDPKGDVSNKALLDRGAGSYTAIADDDATILLTPNTNGEADKDALTVEVIHRNRAPLDPFVAVFDGETQTFHVDDTISPDTSSGNGAGLTAGEKAKRHNEKMVLFAQAAVEVANEAGDNLIDCNTFKTRLLGKPNGNLFGAVTGGTFKTAWSTITIGKNRPLKKCAVKDRGSTKREFVSTPDRIDRYLSQCESDE